MALIVFSHANSFPVSTYRVLFRHLRTRHFTVKAIEKLGHDPAYPVTNNWPHLVQQLADFAQAEVDKAGEPAFLVGHSLGGFLSLQHQQPVENQAVDGLEPKVGDRQQFGRGAAAHHQYGFLATELAQLAVHAFDRAGHRV